ncbi:hypothetical protein BD408DRAFT_419973 [Parasitella parasitica]|nr:hypothetical protein BD408DRAFT_419973 [Parasitella parasitica]
MCFKRALFVIALSWRSSSWDTPKALIHPVSAWFWAYDGALLSHVSHLLCPFVRAIKTCQI